MKSPRITFTALICALCLAGAVAAAETGGTEAAATQEGPCCFENPRFSGTCQVTPGPEETCGDILAYLNNPNSVGKAYCGNTKVRGGWTQVSCEGSASTIAVDTCGESRE